MMYAKLVRTPNSAANMIPACAEAAASGSSIWPLFIVLYVLPTDYCNFSRYKVLLFFELNSGEILRKIQLYAPKGWWKTLQKVGYMDYGGYSRGRMPALPAFVQPFGEGYLNIFILI